MTMLGGGWVRGPEVAEGERGGAALREIVSFISFFLVRLSFFLGNSGEQESGEPLYDGGVPHGFAKDY